MKVIYITDENESKNTSSVLVETEQKDLTAEGSEHHHGKDHHELESIVESTHTYAELGAGFAKILMGKNHGSEHLEHVYHHCERIGEISHIAHVSMESENGVDFALTLGADIFRIKIQQILLTTAGSHLLEATIEPCAHASHEMHKFGESYKAMILEKTDNVDVLLDLAESSPPFEGISMLLYVPKAWKLGFQDVFKGTAKLSAQAVTYSYDLTFSAHQKIKEHFEGHPAGEKIFWENPGEFSTKEMLDFCGAVGKAASQGASLAVNGIGQVFNITEEGHQKLQAEFGSHPAGASLLTGSPDEFSSQEWLDFCSAVGRGVSKGTSATVRGIGQVLSIPERGSDLLKKEFDSHPAGNFLLERNPDEFYSAELFPRSQLSCASSSQVPQGRKVENSAPFYHAQSSNSSSSLKEFYERNVLSNYYEQFSNTSTQEPHSSLSNYEVQLHKEESGSESTSNISQLKLKKSYEFAMAVSQGKASAPVGLRTPPSFDPSDNRWLKGISFVGGTASGIGVKITGALTYTSLGVGLGFIAVAYTAVKILEKQEKKRCKKFKGKCKELNLEFTRVNDSLKPIQNKLEQLANGQGLTADEMEQLYDDINKVLSHDLSVDELDRLEGDARRAKYDYKKGSDYINEHIIGDEKTEAGREAPLYVFRQLRSQFLDVQKILVYSKYDYETLKHNLDNANLSSTEREVASIFMGRQHKNKIAEAKSSGDFPKVEQFCKEAIIYNPKDLYFSSELSLFYMDQGNSQAAINVLINFKQLNPDDPRVDTYFYGIASRAIEDAKNKNDHNAIISICTQGQEQYPSSLYFVINKAIALNKNGKTELANECLKEFKENNPGIQLPEKYEDFLDEFKINNASSSLSSGSTELAEKSFSDLSEKRDKGELSKDNIEYLKLLELEIQIAKGINLAEAIIKLTDMKDNMPTDGEGKRQHALFKANLKLNNLAECEKILSTGNIDKTIEMTSRYELGKAYEKEKDYGAAYRQYAVIQKSDLLTPIELLSLSNMMFMVAYNHYEELKTLLQFSITYGMDFPELAVLREEFRNNFLNDFSFLSNNSIPEEAKVLLKEQLANREEFYNKIFGRGLGEVKKLIQTKFGLEFLHFVADMLSLSLVKDDKTRNRILSITLGLVTVGRSGLSLYVDYLISNGILKEFPELQSSLLLLIKGGNFFGLEQVGHVLGLISGLILATDSIVPDWLNPALVKYVQNSVTLGRMGLSIQDFLRKITEDKLSLWDGLWTFNGLDLIGALVYPFIPTIANFFLDDIRHGNPCSTNSIKIFIFNAVQQFFQNDKYLLRAATIHSSFLSKFFVLLPSSYFCSSNTLVAMAPKVALCILASAIFTSLYESYKHLDSNLVERHFHNVMVDYLDLQKKHHGLKLYDSRGPSLRQVANEFKSIRQMILRKGLRTKALKAADGALIYSSNFTFLQSQLNEGLVRGNVEILFGESFGNDIFWSISYYTSESISELRQLTCNSLRENLLEFTVNEISIIQDLIEKIEGGFPVSLESIKICLKALEKKLQRAIILYEYRSMNMLVDTSDSAKTIGNPIYVLYDGATGRFSPMLLRGEEYLEVNLHVKSMNDSRNIGSMLKKVSKDILPRYRSELDELSQLQHVEVLRKANESFEQLSAHSQQIIMRSLKKQNDPFVKEVKFKECLETARRILENTEAVNVPGNVIEACANSFEQLPEDVKASIFSLGKTAEEDEKNYPMSQLIETARRTLANHNQQNPNNSDRQNITEDFQDYELLFLLNELAANRPYISLSPPINKMNSYSLDMLREDLSRYKQISSHEQNKLLVVPVKLDEPSQGDYWVVMVLFYHQSNPFMYFFDPRRNTIPQTLLSMLKEKDLFQNISILENNIIKSQHLYECGSWIYLFLHDIATSKKLPISQNSYSLWLKEINSKNVRKQKNSCKEMLANQHEKLLQAKCNLSFLRLPQRIQTKLSSNSVNFFANQEHVCVESKTTLNYTN